ncbi:MAG: hypothetical protein ACOCQ3_05510 [Natronomonas sp.]
MSRTVTRSDATIWEGPILELDKYGEPTGYQYVRCVRCGVEVLTDDRQNASHHEGCVHA